MSNWRKSGQNTYSFCNSYERKYQIVMYLPEYNVMYRWFSNRCFSQLKDWRTGTKFSVWDGILQEGFLLTRTKQRFSQVLSRSPSRSILLVFRSDLRALKRAVSTPSSTPIVFYFLRLTYAETMCYTSICIQPTEPDALSSWNQLSFNSWATSFLYTVHTLYSCYLLVLLLLGGSVNLYSVVNLHLI